MAGQPARREGQARAWAQQCPPVPGCSQAAQPKVTFIEESALKQRLRNSIRLYLRCQLCCWERAPLSRVQGSL